MGSSCVSKSVYGHFIVFGHRNWNEKKKTEKKKHGTESNVLNTQADMDNRMRQSLEMNENTTNKSKYFIKTN